MQFNQHLAEKYIAASRHTGTGKDEIHNSAFKYGSAECVKHIAKLFDAFTKGQLLLSVINKRLFVVLQKSDRDDGRSLSADGIYRRPGDLCPLALIKNCDNKCVAGICNWIVKLLWRLLLVPSRMASPEEGSF